MVVDYIHDAAATITQGGGQQKANDSVHKSEWQCAWKRMTVHMYMYDIVHCINSRRREREQAVALVSSRSPPGFLRSPDSPVARGPPKRSVVDSVEGLGQGHVERGVVSERLFLYRPVGHCAGRAPAAAGS
eukprot:282822-Chlamydomonas_euryale.AAC.2